MAASTASSAFGSPTGSAVAHDTTSSRTRRRRGPGPTSPRKRCTDALDSAAILQGISPSFRYRIRSIDVEEVTASTNDDLLALPASELHGRVLLAERQSAGKGRRGRRWQAPPGNILMSIGWRFEGPATSLGALGPFVGVCVCRALARLGLSGHGIKWPNDVVLGDAKLGGILVESRAGRSGAEVVIGIGINVRLGDDGPAGVDQARTDLERATGLAPADRNGLVAALLEELVAGFDAIADRPGGYFDKAWREWDVLRGTTVRVLRADAVIEGEACGIAEDGSLRVRPEGGGGMQSFHSGEVSVRRA